MTPRHIGIVACSAEGAALCYRTICVEGAAIVENFREICQPAGFVQQWAEAVRSGSFAYCLNEIPASAVHGAR